MDSVPDSVLFGRYRSALPGLVGAGASAIASAFLGGRRAKSAIDRDSPVFPTWKGSSPMAYRKSYPARRFSSRRSYGRSRRSYRKRVSRRRYVQQGDVRTVVRTTAPGTFSIAAGSSFASGVVDYALSIVQYSDLTALYNEYRILKATRYVWLKQNPSNGAAKADPNTQPLLGFSADPTGSRTAPATFIAHGADEGFYMKILQTADQVAKFTLYPRPLNAVGSGTARGVYYNAPWIRTDAPSESHYRLIWSANVPDALVALKPMEFNAVDVLTVQFRGMR